MKFVIKETGNTNIEYVSLDLASKESIREFAGIVSAKYPRIDFLINNDG